MAKLRGTTIALTMFWGLLCLATLIRYPAPSRPLVYASLGYIAYYILVSLIMGRQRG
jgi:hypothetical protein